MRIGLVAGLLAALGPALSAVAQTPPTLAAPAASPGLTARIEGLPALLAGPDRYREAFAPAFQTAVPEEAWRRVLAGLAASAGKPLAVERVDVASPQAATVQVRFERALVSVRIAVEAAAPWRITGLFVTGLVAAEASVPAVADAIRALPGTAALAVARLGGDAPASLWEVASGRVLSVGSEFKLVVLAAIVRAIAAGERHWDDPVALDGRPVAGGRYAALPAGTAVPLRELAQAMISVSDNSAADILVATLGRERIEAMLPELGIADPAGMRPFLTALEAFKLKAMIAEGHTEWLRADEAERRRLLAGPVAARGLDGIDRAFAAGMPLSVDTVEWRASPDDMVRVLDWLRRHTESGPAAEARLILARNPGVGGDAAAGWGYVGYKGGSEPGVIAMSLLLQRPSGEWLAVSAGWNDPARPVDEGRFVALVTRLVALLRDGG